MESAKEKLKASISKVDNVETALSNLSQAVKQSLCDHKTFLDTELRRAHTIIVSLTNERDLAVEQLIKAKRIINQIKQDLG